MMGQEIGILERARQIADDRDDGYDKCVHLLHELRRQRAVAMWMGRNQSHWRWMESDNGPEQQRGDYSVRRGENRHQALPNHNMSDYDEDDDDDYEDDSRRLDPMFDEVSVEGCGIQDINGVYVRSGHCDEVPRYSKQGKWDGKEVDFMLFRCKLSDNTRRWYISIVPDNSKWFAQCVNYIFNQLIVLNTPVSWQFTQEQQKTLTFTLPIPATLCLSLPSLTGPSFPREVCIHPRV